MVLTLDKGAIMRSGLSCYGVGFQVAPERSGKCLRGIARV